MSLHGLNSVDTITAAMAYAVMGWRVVPVDRGAKAPRLPDWPNLVIHPEAIPDYFDENCNVGVVNGSASGGLVNIDIDDPIARRLAPYFLPETATYSRRDKFPEHYLYLTGVAVKTRRFIYARQTIIDLLGDRSQCIMPPSHHPSGDVYQWDNTNDVAEEQLEFLLTRVNLLFCATVLTRNWPDQGIRQELSMAISGFLLRNGWTVAETENFLRAITTIAGDEEAEKRIATVKYTKEKINDGEEVTGLPTVKMLMGQQIADILASVGGKASVEQTAEYQGPRKKLLSLVTTRRGVPTEEIIAVRRLIANEDNDILPYLMAISNYLNPRTVVDDKPIDRVGVIGEAILQELLRRGRFVKTSNAPDAIVYYYDAAKRQVYSFVDEEFKSYLLERMNTADNQTWTGFYKRIEAAARHHAEVRDVYLFSHYDEEAQTLYIHDGEKVWRIRSDSIDTIPNGEELLFESSNATPVPESEVDIPDSADIDDLIDILEYRSGGGGIPYLDKEVSAVHAIFALAIPFGDFLKVKPIEVFIGPPGSGKSMAATRLGKLLLGPDFTLSGVPSKVESLKASLHKNVLLALDNAEHFPVDYFDPLAMASTGGSDKKRKLYSNSEIVSLPYRSWVVLTAVMPAFRRPDLASRMLILELEERSEYAPENEVISDIEYNRGRYWGVYLALLQKIVRELPNWKEYRLRADEFQMRTRAFHQFCRVVWAASDRYYLDVDRHLKTLGKYQHAFVAEGDAIYDGLLKIIESRKLLDSGKLVTTQELHRYLMCTPQLSRLSMTPGTLARKINSLAPALEMAGILVLREYSEDKTIRGFYFNRAISKGITPPV